MLHRQLGLTGLSVSEIGFGAASWWGKRQFSEAAAQRLVHAALEGGVTFFDTGASYSGGDAEPRLGRALLGRDLAKIVVATKAGTFADRGRIGRNFSVGAIVASVEQSLRNLKLDCLPLLQLHGPAGSDLTDDLRLALSNLKSRGLIRCLGVNSFDPTVIEGVTAMPEFDVVMIDYNVLRPEREPLISKAAAAGKGVLAGMPLAMGHTNSKIWRLRAPRDVWYAARGLMRHQREVRAGLGFGFLNRLADMSGSQAALAYVLNNPGISCAVVGTTRLAHLTENLLASGLKLDPSTLEEVRRCQGEMLSR